MKKAIAAMLLAAGIFTTASASASSDKFQVPCFEDEIARPARWIPGTPREGLKWECVHADDYAQEQYEMGYFEGLTKGYASGKLAR